MRKIFAVVLSAAWLLASCGGSGTEDAFREGGGLPPGSGGTATATQISIASDATTIPSDGSSAATITAYARDASNVLVPGVAIRFSANSGGITPAQAVTNAAGEATATLNTAGDTTPRTIVVTAASGTLTATANVMVTSGGTGAPTVSIGSGTGAAFQSGIIGIANNMLSAGGSTSLTAVLQQSDGTLYQQAANVSFSSPCAASGRATIQSPVTTSTGIASTTYVATGCSGSDVISASATIGGIQLSASGSVTVATAAIGSIEFVSATPTNVALRGTGAPGRSETSTVVFRVLDSSGGPRADADVDFSLNTTVGGIALNPTTARSDANGRVQTVVQAGDSATTVRVTARVLNTTPAISTQSSQLTITTGVPDDDSLSLAVACPNVEALSYDGVPVTVTARLADRFNNPVPDGTAVTFNTEGGRIGGQCTTATTPTEGGVCAVTWTSSAPRPSNGRVTLIATAIGEETFTDANGNGAFDNGETFIDRAERFRDDNENGVYDSGEYFYDFNTNGIRDPADGLFNGLLCRDTTGRC
ncbi:MAG TPA: Ig-like domain-containing protein, partial [Steroidobacteraceae bacterium]|nr:Ig-like domain-containing protein [Steroidobacteraceae bacterium]